MVVTAALILTLPIVCLFYITVVTAAALLEKGKSLAPALSYSDRLHCLHEKDFSGTLEDCLLIGTHGSAAYRVTPSVVVNDRGVGAKQTLSWLSGLVRRWSLNQHYDVYSQLCMGARFLQWQVGLHQNEWVTLHSYLCGDVAADMTQVVRFVEEKGNQAFVLLSIQLWVNEDSVDSRGRTIWAYLSELGGSHVRPTNTPVSKWTPLQSLRRKIVIVTGVDCRMYPSDYTTNQETFDKNRSLAQIKSHLSETADDNRLACFQWVMTPDTQDVVQSALLPYPVTGLYSLPAVVDDTGRRNILNTLRQIQPGFQVFLVDHLTPSIAREIDTWNATLR